MQYTLSIIKPDAVQKNLTQKINDILQHSGMTIIEKKMLTLTKKEAEGFYKEHSSRAFFSSLIKFMISGNIIVQIMEGDNVIEKNRSIMGVTDPKLALPNTIRAMYGENIEKNAIHGSDSKESAIREILFFFPNFNKGI